MNSKIASCRSGSLRCHPVGHLAAFLLFAFGWLPPLQSISHAAVAGGGTKATSCLRCNPDGTHSWVMRVDPADVQSFQLTITYDPTRATPDTTFAANGVIFKTPFAGSSTNLVAGQLIVSGSTAPANVTTGDTDIFEIVFNNLQPGLPVNTAVFSVGGVGPTDFIGTFDPTTSTPGLIPSAQIGVVTRTSPVGVQPLIWDPDGAYNNGTTGGAGTWDATSNRFDNLPTIGPRGHDPALADVGWTTANNASPNNLAVFGGNPGTGLVTVAGTIAVGGLEFDMPGYQLSGGTLQLSPASGGAVTVEIRDGTATLNTALAGSSGLTKTGPGTLILNGSKTYTGATTVADGIVQISTDQNLGAAPPSFTPGKLVLAGGTLRVTSTMTLNTNRGVTLSAANGTVDVATGGNLIYAGVIAGTGSLTKVGAGTLTVSGSNTFLGGTTVLAGVLVNNGSLASGVVVQSGRLSGSGSVAGAVTIGDGVGAGDAIIRPAAIGVPATLTLGSLSLNSDAKFELTLNSNASLSDQLFINGSAILGNGIAQLSVFDLGSTTLPIGTIFTILKNPSGTTSGFFNGLPDGADIFAGLNEFEIDYNVGLGGNDVQLKVVPEADAAAALAAALLLAVGARRARFRRR